MTCPRPLHLIVSGSNSKRLIDRIPSLVPPFLNQAGRVMVDDMWVRKRRGGA